MAKAEGAATFPYLKDPNTGVSMIESDDIVEYLFRTYGPVANRSEAPAPNASPEELGVPFMLRRGGITNPTCYAAAVARLKAPRARGRLAPPPPRGGRPARPLVLWTYEASPFTKAVRESLTELAIPHVVRYCPRGSKKRDELQAKTGRFRCRFGGSQHRASRCSSRRRWWRTWKPPTRCETRVACGRERGVDETARDFRSVVMKS